LAQSNLTPVFTVVSAVIRGHSAEPFQQDQVDGRSGRQWLNSAMAYCDWRSGDSWRRSSDRASRHSADRWDWIDAVRLLKTTLNSSREPMGIHPALPVLNPAPTPTADELVYAKWKRAEIVNALLEENPLLTDRKILMHLSKPKLAGMLANTRLTALETQRVMA